MSDIADRVKKIVVEHLGVEEDKVTETASFIDDLGADSLDTVELVMAFEEEFGIEIPDDAAAKRDAWARDIGSCPVQRAEGAEFLSYERSRRIARSFAKRRAAA